MDVIKKSNIKQELQDRKYESFAEIFCVVFFVAMCAGGVLFLEKMMSILYA